MKEQNTPLKGISIFAYCFFKYRISSQEVKQKYGQ